MSDTPSKNNDLTIKFESSQKMELQYSTLDIFDALFELYDAVQNNENAKIVIDNYIYRVAKQANSILHSLPEVAKERFIENIKMAKMLASAKAPHCLDIPEIISTVKTPRQYKYIAA